MKHVSRKFTEKNLSAVLSQPVEVPRNRSPNPWMEIISNFFVLVLLRRKMFLSWTVHPVGSETSLNRMDGYLLIKIFIDQNLVNIQNTFNVLITISVASYQFRVLRHKAFGLSVHVF